MPDIKRVYGSDGRPIKPLGAPLPEESTETYGSLRRERDALAEELRGAVKGERTRIVAWLRRRAENVVDGGAHAALVKAADDLDGGQ